MCTVRPVDRLYVRRCQVAVGVSLVLYIASSQMSIHVGRGPLGLGLAAFSGLAFFAEVLAVAFLVVRRLDEFQRVLMLHSFLWGVLLTMLFTMIYGALELHARGAVPQLSLLVVPVMLILFTTAAKVLIFRRNRSNG